MPKIKSIDPKDRIKVEDIHYPADVKRYVLQIKDVAQNLRDDEAAHGMEDALHKRVLEIIANTPMHVAKYSPDLAAEALKTKKIKFERWAG